MQTIRISLMADSTTAQVLDGDLKPTALKPSVTMFTDTQVKLTLYHADMQRYTASELNFGFDFYVDDDFKTATEPKFGTTSGITVDADGVITIPLDLSTQAGAGWIDGSESRPAIAELQGHALSNDDADFVLQFPVRVKNRVFIGGTYTPSPVEGLFYTKAQSDGRFNTKLPIVATSTAEKFLKENGTFSTVTSNVHVSGNTISEAGGDTFVGATFSHTHTFDEIEDKPDTLDGYGISDAQIIDDEIRLKNDVVRVIKNESVSIDSYGYFAQLSIQGKGFLDAYGPDYRPNTIDGYGITDCKIEYDTVTIKNDTAHVVLYDQVVVDDTTYGTYTALVINDKVLCAYNDDTHPTTLAGYGITDAASSTHTHTFASITSKPTTLAGYGITDAASSTHAHSGTDVKGWLGATVTGSTRVFTEAGTWANSGGGGGGTTVHVTGNTVSEVGGDTFVGSTFSHAHAFSAVTDKPTTLSGYGITDALPTAGGTMTGVITFASTQTFPMATSASAGAVKAESAESGDTQAVRIGADGKLYTAPGGGGGGGVAYYTYIIDTQTKFNAWANNVAGNDYTSVAIVGGTYTGPYAGLSIPSTTQRVDGFCGAKLLCVISNGKNISNIEVDVEEGCGFLNCTGIRCCKVKKHDTNNYGFHNCTDISNCAVDVVEGYPGFYRCTNIANCTVKNYNGRSFENCNKLTNCIGECFGDAFKDCTNIMNCIGKTTNNDDSTDVSVFIGCTNITNCVVDSGDSGVLCKDFYGFKNCSNVSACALFNEDSNGVQCENFHGFFNCKSLSGCDVFSDRVSCTNGYAYKSCIGVTLCVGYVANADDSGYGFYGCKGVSHCSQGENSSATESFQDCYASMSENSTYSVADTANGGFNDTSN